MIDDQDLDRHLVVAGERQRALAPQASDARRALQGLNGELVVDFAEHGRRRRAWPIAVVAAGAAAVVLAFVAIGNSGTDTLRNVPATDPVPTALVDVGPIVSAPLPSADPTAVPSPSTIAATLPDMAITLEFPDASTRGTFGVPSVREFAGVPLMDVVVSPGGDRIAAIRGSDICVISTASDVPVEQDRCYPFPSGVGNGSIAWALDELSLVFHHAAFSRVQESDLIELDLATGELTVLTDDGVPIDGDGGDTDFAPVFTSDGTLYFFRLDTTDGVQSVLHRYDAGDVTATGPSLAGVLGLTGRRVVDDSIVTLLGGLGAPTSELISIDVEAGTTQSILLEGSGRSIADSAAQRVLLVSPNGLFASGLQLTIADFASGNAEPIVIPQLAESSMLIVGGGLSPDGAQVAVMLADQVDPDGHLLLVADIATDGTVGSIGVLAVGSEFAPNDGDRTIKPAGIGSFGEIVWTESGIVYALGPNEIVTLPMP